MLFLDKDNSVASTWFNRCLVMSFIVAPRLETLYARVCMCFDAFDTPTSRACRCIQNTQTGRIYTRTIEHVNRMVRVHRVALATVERQGEIIENERG